MKAGKIIGLGAVLLIAIYVWFTFNAFVNKEEKMNLQWNEMQNVYQRR